MEHEILKKQTLNHTQYILRAEITIKNELKIRISET